jgi:hypothetical protein
MSVMTAGEPMPPTVTTTLRMPEKVREWMKVAAERENRTVSNLIITVMTTWLREHHPDAEPDRDG